MKKVDALECQASWVELCFKDFCCQLKTRFRRTGTENGEQQKHIQNIFTVAHLSSKLILLGLNLAENLQ